MADSERDWEPCSTPPLTAEDVRLWEEDYALRLPAVLARALLVQNGGRVRQTDLTISSLDDFSMLDELQWDHVFADGPLASLDRGRLLYIGEAAGCGVVLDYATTDQPRVLLVHHNLGGELRDQRIASLEDLLRLLRMPPR